jgi:hypothetical protein
MFKKPGGFFLPVIMSLLLFTAFNRNTPRSLRPILTNELFLVSQSGTFSVWAAEADKQTALDILAAIQTGSRQVCMDLQTDCQFSVMVEIYPDQSSFDEQVMDSEMRGFFAISGNGDTIQMVSPANPSPHKISYEDGVFVAIHEFAHLALDEINPQLPPWLDEGVAVYIGPHTTYTTVCQVAFPFEMIPSFEQLVNDYHEVQAPDLFAYAAVDFIVHEFGLEKLNLLLRTPDDLEQVLGISQAGFEAGWHEFIQAQYRNYKLQVIPVFGITCVIFFILGSIVIRRMRRRR